MRWGRGTTTACVGGPGAVARGSVTVGAVLVLVLGLAGCAPEPIPPVPTTDRPSPTVEPTPEPEPEPAPETVHPDRPAAMDIVDAAGAEAAVEYFLSLFPYVHATGDLDEWQAMSHPDCIYCASVTERVMENEREGFSVEGGVPTFLGVESSELTAGSSWTVDIDLLQAPTATHNNDGEVVSSSEAVEVRLNTVVLYDGSWQIRGVATTRD